MPFRKKPSEPTLGEKSFIPPPLTTPQIPKPKRPECKKTLYCKFCANCISYGIEYPIDSYSLAGATVKEVICVYDTECERFRLKGEL